MREQNKLHYKMYKSGKNWVIAGIITATTIVSLYEVTGTQSFDVKAETSSSISNNTSVLTNRVQLSRSSGADNSATITSSAVNSATSYSSVSSSHSSASSLSSADSVASSNVSLVSTDSSAQSSNQSSAQSSSESNKSSSSDSSSNQSSGSSSNSKPSILFDATIASNASSVLMDHIKVINGKTYYLNDNNSYAKSEIIKDNSDYYYFGADGTLTTDKPNLSSGTISSNDKIAIYSADGSNIDNIDGFINADSWYRPKEVQNSDGSYRESTPSDYRPLISVWWPSRQVEQNYLNYMSSQGLLQGSFSDSSTSDELDQAASEVRTNIDKSIASNSNNITTIKNIFSNFVNSQPEWNITGENFNSNDGIQGGSLLYGNNPNTTDTNSDYRLINRNPTQQNGQVQYKKTDFTGSEFLLADDVDNSNPVVQAETLNWLYYMMNFGSITKNDSNANFDGVRVDAVDNVDADVLNIISGYFKDAYKTDKSDENANNHLAILEDWSQNDPLYQRDHQNSQISIDTDYHTAIFNSLLSNPNDRTKISSLIDSGIVDRKDDNTENQNIPNYSIVRAHDASVQDIIFKIVNDKMSNSGGLTLENIDKAFEYYNQDENSTNKEYTPYNIPLAYAMTLTNKDTIPRVYYGDMYTDNGQFMANQTIYYDAIQAMLKARSKYVAGGQSMNTVSVNNNQDQILTSVRYGKGALNSTDTGDQLTRTSGIAVVASNDPNLQLATNDKVVINMGAAHKKQAYRQLITSTDDGTKSFDKDSDTNQVIYTDSLGNLTLDSNEIKGYSNPQVSGYLSMWVPVGASDNQDVRTAPSSATTTDNNVFHSNDALDSNVIFEAFSNFQSFAKTNDQYTNAVIANNAKKFKDLGFSYVEMAPQYRSSTDNSFLDSVVQNGYAFTDRYDLGFNTPTKYGTADQLTDAIKALHSQGVKVLADFVPDQLYALPNQQVVSVTRVDSNGVLNRDTDMINTLYQAYSKGSGKDYQYKYGGAFLSKLEEMYPDLFEMKQISTGKPIDPSTIIKVWEAKYLNGTNIQGRGPNYILGSDDNSNYFMVQNPSNPNIVSNVLPNELQGKTSNYGLIEKDGKYRYVTTSGTIATNTFLKDDSGNWYYVDSEGDFVNTPTVIDGRNYYFLSNGISLRNVIIRNPDNSLNYYGNNGAMAKGNGYIYLDNIGKEIYVQKDGSLLVGFVKQGDTLHYYDDDGYQVKGEIINDNGVVRYFNSDQGDLVKDGYIIYNDNFYYAGPDGQLVTGLQNINGNEQFFDENGVQQKGIIENINGHNMYFDAKLGNLVKSDYVLYDGNSYYAGSDGQLVTGLQTIDGQEQYFNEDGVQQKGIIENIDGHNMYFDAKLGNLVKSDYVLYDGNSYYAGSDGQLVTGLQTIDGQEQYFNEDGVQQKGIIENVDGHNMYFDSKLGNLVKSDYINYDNGFYYAGSDGKLLTGYQHINGNIQYFDINGKQAKNQFIQVYPGQNKFRYFDLDGNEIFGSHIINNSERMFFDNDGIEAKGVFERNNDGTLSYYDVNSGNLLTSSTRINDISVDISANGNIKAPNQLLSDGTASYYLDENSHVETGLIKIGNDNYYFDDTGKMTVSSKLNVSGVNYYADSSGKLTKLDDNSNIDGNKSSSDDQNSSPNTTSNGDKTTNNNSNSTQTSSVGSGVVSGNNISTPTSTPKIKNDDDNKAPVNNSTNKNLTTKEATKKLDSLQSFLKKNDKILAKLRKQLDKLKKLLNNKHTKENKKKYEEILKKLNKTNKRNNSLKKEIKAYSNYISDKKTLSKDTKNLSKIESEISKMGKKHSKKLNSIYVKKEKEARAMRAKINSLNKTIKSFVKHH